MGSRDNITNDPQMDIPSLDSNLGLGGATVFIPGKGCGITPLRDQAVP